MDRKQASPSQRIPEKLHYMSFHIAGFTYYEGCEEFDRLKLGSILQLVRE